MSKRVKQLAMVSVMSVAAMGSGAAAAEFSANAALTSNYVFRGFTQTDDGPAVQGGLDYAHDSGVYVGTWASNVDEGFEVDVYLGYSGEVNGFGYDIGYITYEYTDEDFFDGAFREAYVGGSYGPVSLKYFDGTETAGDTDYSYVDLGLEFTLPQEISLGLHYGLLNSDVADVEDIADYSVSLGKEFAGVGVSASFATNDSDEEDVFFVTLSKDFDL